MNVLLYTKRPFGNQTRIIVVQWGQNKKHSDSKYIGMLNILMFGFRMVGTTAIVRSIPKQNQYIGIQYGSHFSWIWNVRAVWKIALLWAVVSTILSLILFDSFWYCGHCSPKAFFFFPTSKLFKKVLVELEYNFYFEKEREYFFLALTFVFKL